MTIKEKVGLAIERAKELTEDYGLDFDIKVNRKRTSLAETHHDTQTIFLSKYFITVADEDQFDGVVLHEVAHALIGPGFGHGAEFQEICGLISPTDEFVAPHTDKLPIRSYKYECENCDYFGFHNAKKDNLGCVFCDRIDIQSRLVPGKNNLELKEWS